MTADGGETVEFEITLRVRFSEGTVDNTLGAAPRVTITINDAPPRLAFTDDATTLVLYYPYNAAITPITFPAATGGTTPYMYAPVGTLPAGLTFDADNRVLSGTPTLTGTSSFIYRGTDSASPAAVGFLEVTTVICLSGGTADGTTVCAPPTPPSSYTFAISPTMVTESATPTDVTFMFTLNGGTFNVDRVFRVRQMGGSATSGTDYTAITPNVTIPANMASGRLVVPFTAIDDMTAEAGGETVVFNSSLLTPTEDGIDGSIGRSQARTLTINDSDIAPAFTNAAAFATPIEAAENQTAVGAADFFVASGTAPVNLTLGGTDRALFAITNNGTLTFMAAPDFEMPRGMALSGSNTNNYALTVTAMNSAGMAESGAITVTVTDVEAPGAPTLRVGEVTPNSITINWETPVNGPPISEYEFEFDVRDAGSFPSFFPAADATSYTFNGLTPETSYIIALSAKNAEGGSRYADATITVTTPALNSAPAFINMAMFTTPIEAAENQQAAGVTNFFVATGTGVTYTLGGTNAGLFEISTSGTLTFMAVPNFEMPSGVAISGSNTNNYTLTVTAMNSTGSALSGAITVTVTDENEAPVVDRTRFMRSLRLANYREYQESSILISVTDEDLPAQTLTYTLADNAFGAIITGNNFIWKPREADGGVARSFTLTVTDSGTPSASTSVDFTITATELANRAPTGAAITAAATVTAPNTLTLEAAATDPDTGDVLTYTWSSSASGDTFDPATGTSVTWTPAAVTSITTVTVTVTVSDAATPPLTTTAMHEITVNPPVAADTAPAFASDASIPDQSYIINQMIEPLTLPAATGGNGTLTYTLTPAIPGLSLDSSTGVLSGTPTTAAATAMYTYTAADGDDNMAADDLATLTFTITVSPMVTGIDDLTDGTFNIYPNPVSGRLTVERKGIAGDEISIHDLTGRRIHVPVREQSPRKVVLDVSGLAGGMYLVKVSGSGSTVRRLIVEHRQERF